MKIDLIGLLRIIGNPAFRNFVTSEKDDFAIEQCFASLQEILHSHPFLMSRIFKMQGCQWYAESNLFSRVRGMVEQGLGQLFIPSRVLISSINLILSMVSP